jgi:hypothetical protein
MSMENLKLTKNLYLVSEVSNITGWSKKEILKMAKKGQIVSSRFGPHGRYRIPLREVNRLSSIKR